jgi:hypothetical protein
MKRRRQDSPAPAPTKKTRRAGRPRAASAPLEDAWRPRAEEWWLRDLASAPIIRRPRPVQTVQRVPMSLPPSTNLPTHYERRALDIAAAMLEDPATLRSYNAMENTNRRAVLKELNVWARNKGLSANTRDALANALDIKTRADFHATMNSVIAHVKRWTALEPYALIVEFGSDRYPENALPKSSMWLAAAVIRGIGRPPGMIIPYFVFKGGDGRVSTDLIRTAVARGIRSFVHVDDAMYSGDQKKRLIEGVMEVITRDGIDLSCAQFKSVRGDMQRRYGVRLGNGLMPTISDMENMKVRTQNGRAFRFLVATAYSTAHARARLKTAVLRDSNSNDRHRYTLDLFVANRIPKPRVPVEVVAELRRLNNTVNTSMTLLPFKVPNYASFGPQSFGERLEKVLPKPPYKMSLHKTRAKKKSAK